MTDFIYSGDDDRYYPSLALSVHPGDSVTLDADPGDGRFTPKGSSSAPKAVSAPAPVADPKPTEAPEVGQ